MQPWRAAKEAPEKAGLSPTCDTFHTDPEERRAPGTMGNTDTSDYVEKNSKMW